MQSMFDDEMDRVDRVETAEGKFSILRKESTPKSAEAIYTGIELEITLVQR